LKRAAPTALGCARASSMATEHEKRASSSRSRSRVLDPQGQAVTRALGSLGSARSRTSAWARSSELDLEAKDPAEGEASGSRTCARSSSPTTVIEELSGGGDPLMLFAWSSFPGSKLRPRRLPRGQARPGCAARYCRGTRNPRPARRGRGRAARRPSPTATTCAPARSRALAHHGGDPQVRPPRRARGRHLQRVPDPAGGRMLPGAMRRNDSLKYVCRDVNLKVENAMTPWTRKYAKGDVIRIPIGHGDGNYYIDSRGLAPAGRRRAGRVPLRRSGRHPRRLGHEPERLPRRHRGHHQRARKRPRHDAPPERLAEGCWEAKTAAASSKASSKPSADNPRKRSG